MSAALDVPTGRAITQREPRHRHQEYLASLQGVEQNVPPDMDVHLVVHNYATPKHPRVKRWLAKHPRRNVHCTRSYASRLYQIEICFNLVTQRAI